MLKNVKRDYQIKALIRKPRKITGWLNIVILTTRKIDKTPIYLSADNIPSVGPSECQKCSIPKANFQNLSCSRKLSIGTLNLCLKLRIFQTI